MARTHVKKRASKAPVNSSHRLNPYAGDEEITVVEVPRPNSNLPARKLTPPPLKRSLTPSPATSLPISQMPASPHPLVHMSVNKYDSETDTDTSPENVKVTIYQKIFIILDSMNEDDKLSTLAMIEAFASLSLHERNALTTIVEKLANSR
jgi:hypothetical protein